MSDAQAVIDGIYPPGRAGRPDVIAELEGRTPATLRLLLIFKANQEYCCGEPGCHLGLDEAAKRQAIIDGLRKLGVVISRSSAIKVLAVVQAGAIFRIT